MAKEKKNISVPMNADLLALIETHRDDLEGETGIRPSMVAVIRMCIRETLGE